MLKFLGVVVVIYGIYWAWAVGYIDEVLDYFSEYSRKPVKETVTNKQIKGGYSSDRYRSGLDLMLGR